MAKSKQAVRELEELVNEEELEDDEEEELGEEEEPKGPRRKDIIRGMFEGGKTRSEIAKELNVRYQTVYTYTKDAEGPASHRGAGAGGRGRGKIMLKLADGSKVARVDWIRDQYYNLGKKRGEIVKTLKDLGHEVSFQIVFAATKMKADEGEEGGKASAMSRLSHANAVAEVGDEGEELVDEEEVDEDLFPDSDDEEEREG